MSLKKMSVAELRRELDRREKGSGTLLKQHAKLSKRLAAIDAELADLGVEAPARRGRKPGRMPGRRGPGRPKGSKNKGARRSKGGMTLLQALHKAIATGKTVSPMEAAAAAKRVGYKTASKTFGIQVASLLAKAPGFKKTGRGQYLRTVGGGSAPKASKRGRKAKKSGRKPGRPKGSKNKPKAAVALAA